MKKEIKGFVCGVCLTTLLMGIATASGVWKTINVQENGVRVKVNGVVVDKPNFVYDGTTYLPLRSMGEILNKDVDYDTVTNTAIVNDKKEGAEVKKDNADNAINKELTIDDVNLYGLKTVIDKGGVYLKYYPIIEKFEELDKGYKYGFKGAPGSGGMRYIGKMSFAEYEKLGLVPKDIPAVTENFDTVVGSAIGLGELISLEEYHRAIEPMIKALVEKQK